MSEPQQPAKRYLSYEEASVYIGCSTATLHRWREAGLLESHKVGRLVRFRIEDLDRALRHGSCTHGD